MATAAELAELRQMVDEPTTTPYDDLLLGDMLTREGTLNLTAVRIWRQKAARFSALVDTTESGSSRRNSQLYSNALEMAKYYQTAADDDVPGAVTEDSAPFTVQAERP